MDPWLIAFLVMSALALSEFLIVLAYLLNQSGSHA